MAVPDITQTVPSGDGEQDGIQQRNSISSTTLPEPSSDGGQNSRPHASFSMHGDGKEGHIASRDSFTSGSILNEEDENSIS